MTAVLVATEQEGVARIYYRGDDHSLTQTAQLLVGKTSPAELATTAADMQDRFRWDRVIAQQQPVVVTTALPPERRKRGPNKEPRLKRTAVEVRAYDDEVLGVIAAHPGITVPEIARTIHGKNDKRWGNNVRAALLRLNSKVRHEPGERSNEAHGYFIAEEWANA